MADLELASTTLERKRISFGLSLEVEAIVIDRH